MPKNLSPTRGLPPHEQPKGPAIVLVHTQMGENIGMAARAMLNCGLTDLRLVAPRDGWPSEAARKASSGAIGVVDSARVFETLEDALADCTFVLATTSRDRAMLKPVLSPEGAADAITRADHAAGRATSALVFGPERTGLENPHITQCDAVVTIPLNPAYASLNMAQAVLLVAYAWYRHQTEEGVVVPLAADMLDAFPVTQADAAPKAQLEGLLEHLIAVLDAAGFFTTQQQRPTMVHNLRNLFQRMRLTRHEVNVFRGMIKAVTKNKL